MLDPKKDEEIATEKVSLWDAFKFWASSEEFDMTQFGSFENDTSLPWDEIDDSVFNHEERTEGTTKAGEILGFTYDEIFGDAIVTPREITTTTTTEKPDDGTFALNAWFKKRNLVFEEIKNADSDKDIWNVIKSG